MPGEVERDVCVAVFARAPRPGHTKTRLIPALGAEGAAALYRAFLADTVRTAAKLEGATVELWAASEADREPLAELHPDAPVRLQPRGDLGERMEAAMADALSRHDKALVVGSDVPTLPARRLGAAVAALEEADVVLGPAADGGYYLVGARGWALAFGRGVRWSTRHALTDTLAAARAAGRRPTLLAPWYDVDTPEDLRLLRAHLAVRRDAAPATAAAIEPTFDRARGA
jgi:rSAM/selenodomain-associated transferase 1